MDIITTYVNLPIWFPVLGLERKCQDVIVITGLKNSKLPLLCVFGLVDQAVADLLNAGLQHKEINEQIHYLVSAFLSVFVGHVVFTSIWSILGQQRKRQ